MSLVKPGRTRVRLPRLAAVALGAVCLAAADAQARSTLYGGGTLYSGGQAMIDTVRASGFNTVVLWTIHVRANGDLVFNDQLVVSNGTYVGSPAWPGLLQRLRQAPTSVERIEIGVGSAGPDDWRVIHDLITAQGTGMNSILFRNFAALKAATGADAINDDDEQHFHVASTVQFAQMAGTLGYRFAIVPYNNMTFWRSVKTSLGTLLDRAYVQCYAGGTGNNPATWASQLGMPVEPGLWAKHGSGCTAGDSPAVFQSKLTAWRQSAGIPGGFLWHNEDIVNCPSGGSHAQYAKAINDATGGGGNGGVVFFQNSNFGGVSGQPLAKGSYTRAQLEAAGVPNDWASSARIPPGWRVTVFEHNNFTGTQWTLTADTPSFRNLLPSANDLMSSCRIE
jgi:hypothetical protein